MPGSGELRTLRRRIRSVRATQKITRSFELIAASRINRARLAVEGARPYAELLTRVIRDLAAQGDLAAHPLLAARDPVRTTGILVLAADRGLAGAYNTNVLKLALRLRQEALDAGQRVRWYSVGRKSEGFLRYRDLAPERAWSGFSDAPGVADAEAVAQTLMTAYRTRQVDRVLVVYTDFRSALRQIPSSVQLLAVSPERLSGGTAYPPQFLFEPDAHDILGKLLPRYVTQRVFAALLESAASEHASRQRAMKAATDNAGDLLEDLTRVANRARQAAITTEISEIVGGAEALGGADRATRGPSR